MNIIIFFNLEILYSINEGYERHFILVPKYSSITLSFFLPVSYLSVFNLWDKSDLILELLGFIIPFQGSIKLVQTLNWCGRISRDAVN